MKISIIIPTYKPQEYLNDCLNSLCRQSFDKKDFEVILVLNGCEDPYKSQIEEYISQHMRNMNVRFIHTLQGGVSHARNLGLKHARGTYVTFIDDDDYVSDNYLNGLYQATASGAIPVSNMKAFNDGEDGFVYYEKEVLFQHLKGQERSINEARKFFAISVAKLLPLKDVIKGRTFNTHFKNGEDSLFIFTVSDGIHRVSFSSEDAIYYRRFRKNSALTGKKTPWYIIKSRAALMAEYSKIYFSDPTKYNFTFYTTRMLACLKAIILQQP